MKTITIRIESDRDADLLKQILNGTKFESDVQAIEESETFSEEEFQMLEERWVEYEKNPSSAITFEDFDKQLRDKYGK